MIKKYWRVWWKTSTLTTQQALANRLAAGFFLAGKWIRLLLFGYFIWLLGSNGQMVKDYTTKEMLTFFLVFNLFDLFGQIFFRGIYWFRDQVISGEFDFRLIKPMNPLFQALTRQTDILDVPMFLFIGGVLVYQYWALPAFQIGIFVVLAMAAAVIITAIHILVAALGVITTEVDHTIMIYRDLSAMARFPVDIYHDLIRLVLTWVLPIALAFTLPAKAIMGLVDWQTAGWAGLAAVICLKLALFGWKAALKQYTSASS